MTDESLQPPAGITPHRGSDELNLIDFPIGVLRHQQPKTSDDRTPDELVCTIESYDAELDRVVPRTLTRRTSSKYGFPTPLDEEVLIGLLTLTRQKNNFTSAHVKFRNRELYDLMGWHNNGRARHRLSKALDRLKGLNLKYENSWTSGNNKFEKEFSTGLLDSYELVTRSNAADDHTESSVRWAAEVFADMQRGNVKELDTACFFSLKLSIAKRLYRFLDRYLNSDRPLEMELTKLAAHMGIADTSHIGKIKERLADGIRELEELGNFIKPAARDQRYTKKRAGVWLIRFERVGLEETQSPMSATPSRNRKPAPVTPNDDAVRLVTDFYSSWSGDQHHVATRHELFQANEIIRKFGNEKAFKLLPIVVKTMKKDFPNAYSLGASKVFWPRADEHLGRQLRRVAEVKKRNADQKREEELVKAQKAKLNSQREKWNQLPDSHQSEIRERIMNSPSTSEALKSLIRRGRFTDPMVLLACLAELDRQNTEPK